VKALTHGSGPLRVPTGRACRCHTRSSIGSWSSAFAAVQGFALAITLRARLLASISRTSLLQLTGRIPHTSILPVEWYMSIDVAVHGASASPLSSALEGAPHSLLLCRHTRYCISALIRFVALFTHEAHCRTSKQPQSLAHTRTSSLAIQVFLGWLRAPWTISTPGEPLSGPTGDLTARDFPLQLSSSDHIVTLLPYDRDGGNRRWSITAQSYQESKGLQGTTSSSQLDASIAADIVTA
jgi:hypothetical protein